MIFFKLLLILYFYLLHKCCDFLDLDIHSLLSLNIYFFISLLINADLNGAINIMRKYVNLNYINQNNICNPIVINLYDTKLLKQPVSKSTSQQIV